jgi:hypothetical protein
VVAALVTVISLTADAVVVNLISSLPLASLISLIIGSVMVGEFIVGEVNVLLVNV